MQTLSRQKKLSFSIVLITVSLGMTVFFLECLLHFVFLSPRFAAHFPSPLLSLSRKLYYRVRPNPQLSNEGGKFDPELMYTFKPGSHTLETTEFHTRLEINSLGVRDTEENLKAPEVVVLGDSYTMGWGVETDKMYPSVLRQELGVKLLGAGVPSYGTVRERRILDRIDTSKVQNIIVQYCSNDFQENAAFYANQNRHRTPSKETFDAVAKLQNKSKFLILPEMVFNKLSGRSSVMALFNEQTPDTGKSDAELFLNAWKHASGKGYGNQRVYVFQAFEFSEPESGFIARLNQIEETQRLNIVPLDLRMQQTPNGYFVLDDHWNEVAHRKVGQALAETLRSKTSPPKS